jgi:hypothetical protein
MYGNVLDLVSPETGEKVGGFIEETFPLEGMQVCAITITREPATNLHVSFPSDTPLHNPRALGYSIRELSSPPSSSFILISWYVTRGQIRIFHVASYYTCQLIKVSKIAQINQSLTRGSW